MEGTISTRVSSLTNSSSKGLKLARKGGGTDINFGGAEAKEATTIITTGQSNISHHHWPTFVLSAASCLFATLSLLLTCSISHADRTEQSNHCNLILVIMIGRQSRSPRRPFDIFRFCCFASFLQCPCLDQHSTATHQVAKAKENGEELTRPLSRPTWLSLVLSLRYKLSLDYRAGE